MFMYNFEKKWVSFGNLMVTKFRKRGYFGCIGSKSLVMGRNECILCSDVIERLQEQITKRKSIKMVIVVREA